MSPFDQTGMEKVLEARGEFEVTFQVAKAQIRVQNRPKINVVDFFFKTEYPC